MNLEQLINQFDLITDTEEGFDKIRSIILDLAVRGNLTKQNQKDGDASKLINIITRKREELYEKGEIRKQSDLPEIDKDEIPYELPRNWSWERLGNVGIVNPRLDADEDLEASFVPMKMISEDYSGRHEYEVRAWGDIKRGYTHFGENDVGMAKITPCFENGKAAIFRDLKNGIGAGTTELYVFRAIPETLLPEYVYSFIQSARFKALGKAKMTGTAGQQRVPRSYFEEALFPVPPYEEQIRIVQRIETLFSQVDALEQKVQQDRQVDERLQVAVLDDLQSAETPEASRQSWQRLTDHFEQIYRKPEHIDQLKQAILNEAVRGRLVPQDPNDEPAEKLLERIKEEKQRLYEDEEIRKPKDLDPVSDEELPYQIPKGWSWERLGNLVILERGRSKHRPRNANKLFKNGTYPFIQTGDVANSNGQITEYSKKYNEVGLKQSKLWSKGTLCITIAANIADTGILGIDACFPDSIVGLLPVIKPDETVKYYDYFIQNLQSDLEEFAPSTAQKNINLTILNSLLCPLPPLEEQIRIVEKVQKLFAWCDDLKEKLSRSQQTDQRLLEALVNGRSQYS